MITKKYLFIIFFSFFCSNLFSEEAPKKIILLEENLELEKMMLNKVRKRLKVKMRLT